MIISNYLIRREKSWFDEKWPQLHHVTQLTRRTWPSVKPDQDRILGQVGPAGVLSSVENKPKGGVSLLAFPNFQVPAHDGSIIIIWAPIEIYLVANSIQSNWLLVWLLKYAISDILAKLSPIRRGVKRVGDK